MSLATDSSHHRFRQRMLSFAASVHPIPAIKKIFKSTPSREVSPSPGYDASFQERLPSVVVTEVGRYCTERDLSQLILCSNRFRRLLTPLLYATVALVGNRQCAEVATLLSKRHDLAGYVRRLSVKPNCIEWTHHGEELNEDRLSELLIQLAPSLRSLEAFSWDGMEMPMDDLWRVLKKHCKHLKRIGTSIGEAPLQSDSHLFDFADLRQLSVTVNCRSLEWLAEGMPKTEKLPRRFWVMLIERCPRLEELTLGGPSPCPRIFDIRHVTAGRWPRLRTLTLGDTVLISSNKGEEQSRKDWESFMAFFAWHRSLTGVHLKHAPGSANFPSRFVLPPTSLPRLTSFSGPLKFVQSLPQPDNIRDLSLTCLHHASSSLPPTFSLLQQLPLLTSLSLWVDLSYNPAAKVSAATHTVSSWQHSDDVHVVRSLLVACSRTLTNLDLVCFTRPAFSLKEFSSALTTAPNLRSFQLTKIFRTNDNDMTQTAERIINDNPNLRQFTIHHTQETWFNSNAGRIRHSAQFEVVNPCSPCERFQHADTITPDPSDDVVTLQVHERKRGGFANQYQWKHYMHQVNLSSDAQSSNHKTSKRMRRRSEMSTLSSGSRSVWSWGSAAEHGSPRSSMSSERPSIFNRSPPSRHTSLRLPKDLLV